MKTSAIGLLFAKTLTAAVLVLAACSPEPGSPEWVLAKLREGRVVGGTNLKILSVTQQGEMTAILMDTNAPSIGRLQVFERLIQIEVADAIEQFGVLINDEEPEIRLRTIRWLAKRNETRAAQFLIDRLAIEKEPIVRGNAIQALQRIGRGIAEPDRALLDKMISTFVNSKGEQRRAWATILGGWHSEAVEAALIGALDDDVAVIREAAAKALTGPALRSLERMAPLFVSMLNSTYPEVRSKGISGLVAASYPNRILMRGNECAEQPVIKLLEIVPELPEAISVVGQRGDLNTKDKRLVKELTECIAKFTGADAEAIAASATGS